MASKSMKPSPAKPREMTEEEKQQQAIRALLQERKMLVQGIAFNLAGNPAIAHLQGMEQQKAKMLEDAVEGEISVKFPVVGRSLISVIDMPKDFKYGDKVRVIVIKED